MFDSCDHQEVQASDGALLRACAHGGQLLGWHPAGADGRPAPGDLLWLSPLARCGDGEAIRGGVPVIFPQFSARGPLPKHGLVRDRAWQLTCHTLDGDAVVDAVVTDDERSRGVWPYRFTLSVQARARGDELTLSLSVRHDGPPVAAGLTFTAALHSYFAVTDAALATIAGLSMAPAEDNAAGRARLRLPADPFPALGPRDVAVPDHRGPVILQDGGRRLELTRTGFADLVVWNPGPDHGLADVPPGAATDFVCLEAAQLRPVTLGPGETWRASVHARSSFPGSSHSR